jgi:hypothetical protein
VTRWLVLLITMLFVLSATAQQPPTKGTLEWYVSDALRRGVSEVQIDGGVAQKVRELPLEQALINNTVVLAKQIGEAVVYDGSSIVTLRKYKSIETLSVQNSAINVPLPNALPNTLLPLASDEFIVPSRGGTLVVKGITLTQNSASDGPLRNAPTGTLQLLFLRFINHNYALLNYDERGLFWIDDRQAIHAMSPDTRLNMDMQSLAGGNLDTLRSESKAVAATRRQEASHEK